MNWDFFRDKTGKTFIVNWVGVRAIVRSYLHTKLLWENSQTVVDTNWFGPNVHFIKTDFDKIKSKKDCLTEEVIRDFYDIAINSMNSAIQMLERLLAETYEFEVRFTAQNKQASETTVSNIEQSVSRGEIEKYVLESIRNVSAEALIIGSSFVSGGARYGFLAGGSLLKGFGKYQDTNKISVGLAEAAFTLGMGLLGVKVIPPNASTTEVVQLNIVFSLGQNFIGEPAKAWIGGSDFSDGLAYGALKGGAVPINQLIKDQLSPESLQRVFKSNAKLQAVALPLQVGMKLLTDRTAAAIVDKSKVNSKPQNIPKQENEGLLDTVLLDKKFIESAAVKVYN